MLLFLSAPSLHLLLERERGADVLELCRPHELHRSTTTCVGSPAVALVVLPHAVRQVGRTPDVVGPVGAADDVGEGHPA